MAPRARRNRSGDAGALRASGAPLGAGQQLHGAEAVCAHITSLHEAVRNHAYGFEATLLFCHTVALLVQHGQAIMQSIMQFIGMLQHGLCIRHGFMHGSMQVIGQSAMFSLRSAAAALCRPCAPPQ